MTAGKQSEEEYLLHMAVMAYMLVYKTVDNPGTLVSITSPLH